MTHPNTPRPEAKRKRDPRDTRERLVRSALGLFTTVGYHASTTPQIAARAGVAEGTIYRHFKSKEQLLNHVYQSAVGVFRETLAGSDATLPCRDRLATTAAKWADIAASNPALVRLVFVQPPAVLDQPSRAAAVEFRERLEVILASGKSDGSVRSGSVDLWADVWLQLITLMLQRIADSKWTRASSSCEQVIASAWGAVAAQPRAPS